MMNHKIENELFEIAITAIGAELCSFKSKKTGIEYIWQADPEIWGSHAPVLFPIIGGLKNNTYKYKAKSYQLPKHGFIRGNSSLQVVEKSETSITIELSSNINTKKVYPFEFIFQIAFILQANKLIVSHRVINQGKEEMYFSVGGHPAFNCHLHTNEEYTDYYLEFEQEENLNTWNLNSEGLIAEEGKTILSHSKNISLHPQIFKNDAIIFKSLKSRVVSLTNKKSSNKVIINFPDFNSLGIWAKPNAPFVCIEPWLGYADVAQTNQQLSNKEGIIKLPAQEEFQACFSIEIKE